MDSAKPIKDNLDQGLASGLIDQRIAENREYAPYFPVRRLSNAALAQVEKDISFLNRLSLQLVWDFYGLEALLVEQVVDTTRENFRNLEPGRKKTAIAHISSTIEELIRTGHQAQECLAHHRRDIEGERWLRPNWI